MTITTLKVAVAAVAALTVLLQAGHVRAFGIPEFLEFGECPPIEPMANLNFERYAGFWFDIDMVPNEYADITNCTMTNYTWTGDLMVVEARGLNREGLKMKQGSFMHPTEGQPGVLTVEAEGVPSAPYVIVDTDYETYACVHSCMAMMGFRAAFSWIVSRRPSLDPALIAHCKDQLHQWDVDTSTMLPVSQGKDCPYMNKLDAVLDYSARVQAKAQGREVAVHKVKTDTTAKGVQTVTDQHHRMQEEKDEAEAESSVPVSEMSEEEVLVVSEVVPDRRTQHTEKQEPNGSDLTTPNTGLLVLLLAAIMILVTAPPT
ncbi:crustacyanin-A2 subunit-like [Portunus trituberculatus]|uniref:crustacyanin-A2 subunit-like n=1 Tax=Portunus trituberculatus TaxID=210409 RepID=UPI001E1D0025|nr:crustacyanin-A2 subunit-like [Portunus trituberculatus]XP_045123582.1 crustacyanin-A2 subunit-like [Portunus trituberculatus]